MEISGVGNTNLSAINPKLGNSNLGMDDFFTLLTAQLSNQNMFEPSTDTEFIAQMAQFSTLQQISELSNLFKNTQAVALMGKTVKVSDVNAKGTETVTGTVEKIIMRQGKSMLYINDNYYEVGDVLEVSGKEEI